MTRVLFVSRGSAAGFAPAPTGPTRFHEALPGYAATPLRESPALAERLGVGRVLIKMETDRLGLPSFKVLGASWATVQALRPWIPAGWEPQHGLATLAGATLPAVEAFIDQARIWVEAQGYQRGQAATQLKKRA